MNELIQASHRLRVTTQGKGFIDITEDLRRWLRGISARDGLLTVFVCHTSASLAIQENADPKRAPRFDDDAGDPRAGGRFAPRGRGARRHATGHAINADRRRPLHSGDGWRLTLGIWRGAYVIEHARRMSATSL